MAELNDDVARVLEVHAALGEPLTVWVLHWHSNVDSGHGFSLYLTKEHALNEMKALASHDYGCDTFEHLQQDEEALSRFNVLVQELAVKGFASSPEYHYVLEQRTVE
jgi:hypothetical protein